MPPCLQFREDFLTIHAQPTKHGPSEGPSGPGLGLASFPDILPGREASLLWLDPEESLSARVQGPGRGGVSAATSQGWLAQGLASGRACSGLGFRELLPESEDQTCVVVSEALRDNGHPSTFVVSATPCP